MPSVILIDGDESRTGIELRWYSERGIFVLALDSPENEPVAISIGLNEFRELTDWIKRSGITFSDTCPTCGVKFPEPCIRRPSGKPYGCDHATRKTLITRIPGRMPDASASA